MNQDDDRHRFSAVDCPQCLSLAFQRAGEPNQDNFGGPPILGLSGLGPENLDEFRNHPLDGQPQQTLEVPEVPPFTRPRSRMMQREPSLIRTSLPPLK